MLIRCWPPSSWLTDWTGSVWLVCLHSPCLHNNLCCSHCSAVWPAVCWSLWGLGAQARLECWQREVCCTLGWLHTHQVQHQHRHSTFLTIYRGYYSVLRHPHTPKLKPNLISHRKDNTFLAIIYWTKNKEIISINFSKLSLHTRDDR